MTLVKDPLEGHPQTIIEKIRRSILCKLGIDPANHGRYGDNNFGTLTKSKVQTIIETEIATGRKVEWQKSKEGD